MRQELTGMMVEKANPLHSRFRLTYQTLLLLAARSHSMSMTSFLSQSFKEAARTSLLPVFKRDLRRKRKVSHAPEKTREIDFDNSSSLASQIHFFK
ncbi:DEAD/DEAH box helicase domain protein [Toxoplasma gondii FOU]|uniref:DEAD/DEAH box helicase domain protein n=2 Tax=Toxoplasma gondii TaxID=5811 RepID=A0A086JBH8_TOXGO|nr:DEAD/DEAH box helicase domain protein [Toxoplasma gondii FOU]PUA83167.1 DEAD/DEAH box helicase domain protein [Toxoplasma gondii TgCATBr9]